MAKTKAKKNASFNTLSIIAFCVALIPIWGIAAPILGVIALYQISRTKERGKGLAITAIIIPIVAVILVAAGIVALVVWSNNNTEKEAAKLGVNRQTYSAVKDAVDTNCKTVNLTEGNTDYDGVPYGYQSVTIKSIDGSFAVGTRTCTSQSQSETFIAKNDVRWKVISVGSVPLCSTVNLHKIPLEIASECIDSSGNIVASPATAV